METRKTFKFYDLIMAVFVTVLLCSNLIGVHKVTQVWVPYYGEFIFGAGVLFFPISYLFGDILTEVYGYARSRRVIWAGFGAMIFASLMAAVITNLPSASTMDPERQNAIELIFGQTPRIVLASLLGFWMGEFSNSFVLAKMKILTAGRWLWTRTIGSTFVGEAVDTAVFYPVAFYGVWSNDLIISVMIGNYIMKVMWEVLATPFTYKIVGFLKRAEHEDFYDRETDFNPFTIKT
ncbi:MAG: VUT family protein [Acidobacteria bacterium]|nr:MAG: VUT family protein [Acidobacteriota bacterium]REK01288.1 MAG: VUT family protein [Acidobacteriota bacterium]REK14244.1 MAG: VUT family protein [Acidobacteriota bacterium]REK44959.1 MAG: VUT family protein [Acidobacteriota bacterium]